MKKANLPLIIGCIILLLILAVIIFPELFTDKSPYNMQKMIFSTENNKLVVEAAPYPPSARFILGSDDLGRDVLSMIIYGTGLTILLAILIAIGRFLIAIPMALSAGFGNEISKSIIRQFGILFSAIPALLISVIILKIDFFTGLDKANSIAAFIIVISLVGWPKLGSLIMERVDTINQQPFIKSEVAIGKNRFKIATENVIPHLAPEMIVLFFMEIARALSMIMQLGIFNVFIGLLKIILDTEGGVSFYNVSFEPEWAGMLSSSRNMISVAPWSVLFPALAFFISVLGFNLFGEGLRNILQKKDSMFIPNLRKLMSFDVKGVRMLSTKKARYIIIALVVAISLITVFSLMDNSQYKFKTTESNAPFYNRAVIGTDESVKTAQFIADEMELSGIRPIEGYEYFMKYEISPSCVIESQMLTLNYKNQNITAQYGIDYVYVTAVNTGNLEGSIYDATRDDLFNIDDYTKLNDKFVLIDKAYYNDAAVDYFINDISEKSQAKGILLILGASEEISGNLAKERSDKPVILLSRDFAENIKSDGKAAISLAASVSTLKPEGVNVVGILEGTDEYSKEEAVIIGMRYNYMNSNEKAVLDFNLELMRRISEIHQNKRSIIFMFLDGTISEEQHGIYGISSDYPYSSSKTKAFIDLTGIMYPSFDAVWFSTAQAPFTRQYAWSIGHQLEKELNSKGIEINGLDTIFMGREYYFTDSYADNALFWDNGIATIIINAPEVGSGKYSLDDIGEILLKTLSNNNY